MDNWLGYFRSLLVMALVALASNCAVSINHSTDRHFNTYKINPDPVLIEVPSEDYMFIADEITVKLEPNYTDEIIDEILSKIDGVLIGENSDLQYIYVRFRGPVSNYSQMQDLIKRVNEYTFVVDSFPVLVGNFMFED